MDDDESSLRKELWSPEEDKYDDDDDDDDALNHETFGDDIGEELKYLDWEATVTSTSGFGRDLSLLDRSKLTDGDHDAAAAGGGGGHLNPEEIKGHNKLDNEDALLEERVYRLVMDVIKDDDEELEETVTMKSKLSRLGMTTTNSNTYFLPPQVAIKQMECPKYTEDKLPDRSSVLLGGSSVWPMDPTTTSTPSDQQQHTQQVHHNLYNNRASGINTDADQVSSSQDHRNVFNTVSGQHQHLPSDNAVSMGAQLKEKDQQKPVFKTLEEVERELLEGSSSPPPPMPPNNLQTPSFSAILGNHHRRIMMTDDAEELARELMRPSSSPQRRTVEAGMMSQMTLEQQQRQSNTTTPGSSSGAPTVFNTPTKLQQPSLPQPMTYQPYGFGSPSPNRPPPGLFHIPPEMNVNPMLLQHQQKGHHQQNMNLNMIHHPHGGPQGIIPQRMPGYPFQFRPNFAAQFTFQQHQEFRFSQENPQLRCQPPFIMPMGPPPMGHPLRNDFSMSPGPRGLHPSPNNIHSMRPNKNKTDDDPYRGLMSEKDKQRIRNIQIIQLQNDHPCGADYYSLMFKVRHGVNDPKHQREHLLELFPNKSEGPDPSNRTSYQLAHFENSLGKLQTVSASAPKKMIDSVIRVVDSGPSNRSGVKARRYLLLEVEGVRQDNLYECLLTIQEADIRKTLLLNEDDESNQKGVEATRKVTRTLQSSDKLSEILVVRKGKMVISRLLPLMEPSVRYSVFSYMIRNFKTWAVGGDSSFSSDVDKTYTFLRHCILAADMPHLIRIFNLNLDRSVFPMMVLNKLGFSLIIAAFHRAETLISESLPSAEEELCREWIPNAKQFVGSMLYHMDELPTPVEASSKAIHHLKRFGFNTQVVQSFKDKMQWWLDCGSLVMA